MIISDDNNIEKKQLQKALKEDKKSTLSASCIKFDDSYEKNIRPLSFDDYIGQESIKKTLKIAIEASKKREANLDHLLFYGPPGLGKTTLANIIANELNKQIKITSAPSIERPRDIIGILMQLNDGDVLFIDEIHRLNKIAEEILYPAMEDFSIDLTVGKSQSVKSMRISTARFTLIGATTKAGSLSSPLRDRFGIIHRLEFYKDDELAKIVKRTAKILNLDIDEKAADIIAKRSRYTPRIANRFVKRCADWALVEGDGRITEQIALQTLNALKIDEIGLDNTDRALLELMINTFEGRAVGIEALAVALGEDIRTIEDVYEPFLIQKGLISRTPRGRKVTKLAYKHLNCKCDNLQLELF